MNATPGPPIPNTELREAIDKLVSEYLYGIKKHLGKHPDATELARVQIKAQLFQLIQTHQLAITDRAFRAAYNAHRDEVSIDTIIAAIPSNKNIHPDDTYFRTENLEAKGYNQALTEVLAILEGMK